MEDVIKRHLKPKRYKELMAEEKQEQYLIRRVTNRENLKDEDKKS